MDMTSMNTGNSLGGGAMHVVQRMRVLFLADLFSRLDLPAIAGRCGAASSVKRARITENTGEMILEVEGSPASLSRFRQLLAEQGMEVELIEEKQIT